MPPRGTHRTKAGRDAEGHCGVSRGFAGLPNCDNSPGWSALKLVRPPGCQKFASSTRLASTKARTNHSPCSRHRVPIPEPWVKIFFGPGRRLGLPRTFLRWVPTPCRADDGEPRWRDGCSMFECHRDQDAHARWVEHTGSVATEFATERRGTRREGDSSA